VFDHTSTLRFIETRFGVKVPNLSAWRRKVTGDLTGALNLTAGAHTGVPPLPATSLGDTKGRRAGRAQRARRNPGRRHPVSAAD
jgi:phospholipase C